VVGLGLVNRCRFHAEFGVLVVFNARFCVGFVVVLYLCEKAVKMNELLLLHG